MECVARPLLGQQLQQRQQQLLLVRPHPAAKGCIAALAPRKSGSGCTSHICRAIQRCSGGAGQSDASPVLVARGPAKSQVLAGAWTPPLRRVRQPQQQRKQQGAATAAGADGVGAFVRRVRRGRRSGAGFAMVRCSSSSSSSSSAGQAPDEDDCQGEVTLLDYGAGNVRSIRNAIHLLGYNILEVNRPEDILSARKLIFPGVGAFAAAMKVLKDRGYAEAIQEYIAQDKPFLGICLGLQLLFDESQEFGSEKGLGVIRGVVSKFDTSLGLPVPHIGWNGLQLQQDAPSCLDGLNGRHVYFVHSFRALPTEENKEWVLATSQYGQPFVAAVRKGNVQAVQFHPEKSGKAGLDVLRRFLGKNRSKEAEAIEAASRSARTGPPATSLAKRVIACLDVRANDRGDLVVTKGDQYDVRDDGSGGEVRNLGKPVDLAGRYFLEGADEVTFLNITGFRDFPLGDLPMLEVMKLASERVFVPLTVGGGIRDFSDKDGNHYSSLEVAAEYFRSGADKVSIGSEAVYAAEDFLRTGQKTGKTGIEEISYVYGNQAVVVSIDPRRVYVNSPDDVPHKCIRASTPGPNGEQYVWYQCTVSGGREGRPIGAYELAQAVEQLGAGEILLNCIDRDGQGDGFDLDLIAMVSDAVTIPVIASSGAGCPLHFVDVFKHTNASAALAAGIFHREEVAISEVKAELAESGVQTRLL